MNILCTSKIFLLLSDTNEEQGGVIFLSEDKTHLIPVELENKLEDKTKSFVFLSEELSEKRKQHKALAIAYFWHTHPNEETDLVFLENDKNFLESWGIALILFSKYKKRTNLYFPRSREIKRFDNRDYIAGYLDCIILVYDYLANLGTYINVFFPYERKLITEEAFEKFSELNGYKQVDIKDIQSNLVIAQFQNGYFKHIGVYVGNNVVLHQNFNNKLCYENIYESKILEGGYKIYNKK